MPRTILSWKISQYGCKRYHNLWEDEKQRLTAYRKKYYKIWKNKNALQTKTNVFLSNIKIIRNYFRLENLFSLEKLMKFFFACEKSVLQISVSKFPLGIKSVLFSRLRKGFFSFKMLIFLGTFICWNLLDWVI